MFNRKFFASTLLALVATFCFLTTPVSAQAPKREMPERVTTTIPTKPFACPPIIEVTLYSADIGDGVKRTGATKTWNSFTSYTTDSPFVRAFTFPVAYFDTQWGRSVIGDEFTETWVDVKLEQPGWGVVSLNNPHIGMQTAKENHITGGAVEGQIVFYQGLDGMICVSEVWAKPEQLWLSPGLHLGAPGASFMTNMFCLKRHPASDNKTNHLAFNTISGGDNSFTWIPVRTYQPGTSLDMSFWIVKVTFPCQ